MFKKSWTLVLAGFFLAFFLFLHWGNFDNFFFQDDFYHLGISRISNLKDFLNFFNPWAQQDIHFRPLSTQSFFLIGHLFPPAWAVVALRLVLLGFHLANSYLVFRLINRFLKRGELAVVLAGTYLIAPLHFLSLYYISAFQQILAAFWQLLGFWFFALNKKKWVCLFFTLALLSKETAFTFPALLLIFSYIIRLEKDPKEYFLRFKREWLYWLLLVLIAVVYGLVRIVTFANFPGEGYQFSLSLRTLLGSWRWYLTWLLGAPETVINYAGRLLNFSLGAFLKDGAFWARTFLLTFLAEIAVVCLIMALSIKRGLGYFWPRRGIERFLLWSAFFVISLLPVSFFPYHRFAHYLDLAFFALLILAGQLFLEVKLPRILWVFLFLAFLVNTLASTRVDQKLHWAVSRSEISWRYFKVFEETDPCRQKGVYFIDTPALSAREANIALFAHWGPAYFCRYQPLSVYYQGVNQFGKENQFKVVKID
jgi:hypothetical protein